MRHPAAVRPLTAIAFGAGDGAAGGRSALRVTRGLDPADSDVLTSQSQESA